MGNAPEVFVKRVFWIFEEGRGVTYITELDISELDGSCGFPASVEPKKEKKLKTEMKEQCILSVVVLAFSSSW